MKQNNLTSVIGSSLLLALIILIGNNFVIKNNLESIESMKVWGRENYKLIQELYKSDKFKQQQKVWIDQALAQLNWTAPTQAQAPTPTPQWAQDASAWNIVSKDTLATLKKDAYIKWAKNAKITWVEYSDLECPFCKKLHDAGSVKDMLKKYPDQLNYIFKSYPLPFHQNAPKEAESILCAGDLWWADTYYNYIDSVFTRTTSNGQWFSLDALAPLAKELWINESKFKDCLDSGKFASRASQENSEWSTLFGVRGTPGNVLINNENGKRVLVAGAYPTASFDEAIQNLLK